MATRVQTPTPVQSAVSGTTLTIAFASAVPVGSHIIVVTGWSGAQTITCAVTDAAGNTYADHINQTTGGATGVSSGIHSCKVTTQLNAGAVVTMTISTAATHRLMHAFEYTGLAATGHFDTTLGATGTSTSPASGAITSAATGLIIGACHYNTGTPGYTAGGGFTEIQEVNNASKTVAVSEQINVAAGSYNHQGTIANLLWTDSIAAFKNAAAAADPAVDTNATIVVGEDFRVRFELQELTGGISALPGLHLYASKNGGAYARVTAATDLRSVTTAAFADGDATTNLMTGSTGTFVAGAGDEDAAIGAITIGANGHTEVEWSLRIFSASDGDTFDLRVYRSTGAALDSYGVTPRITADLVPTSPAIGLVPSTLSFNATVGGSDPADKSITITNTGAGTLNWHVSAAPIATVPTTNTFALDNEISNWSPTGHHRCWWNSYYQRWDGILPAAVPPAAAASDWWLVKDITGTPTFVLLVEAREAARPDIVWDDAAKKLYVLLAHETAGLFSSYDYNSGTDTYTISANLTDPGIDAENTKGGSGLWQTPNGHLWVAGNTVSGFLRVNRSTDGGATWGTSINLKAITGLGKVSVTHFVNGGTTYVAVVSAEDGLVAGAKNHFLFIDQASAGWGTAGNWTDDTANMPAFTADYRADDEMSVARDASENIYVCFETEPVGSRATLTTNGDPQWVLWKRTAVGTWSSHTIAAYTNTSTNDVKRPGVTVDDDTGQVYVFGAYSDQRAIVCRKAPLASLGDLATTANTIVFKSPGGSYRNVMVPRASSLASGLLVLAEEQTADVIQSSLLPTWLTLSPASGALAASASEVLAVSPATGDLPIGTYDATIAITDVLATNSPQTVAVTFNVAAVAGFPIALDGVYFETSGFAGPHIDANGNLYLDTEAPNSVPTTQEQEEHHIWKSTDRGHVWIYDVDGANSPTNRDLESLSTVLDANGLLHLAWQKSGYNTHYAQFRTSAHATAPDTWGPAIQEDITAAQSGISDQSVDIAVRSDGSVVAFYIAANKDLAYKIRSAGGTWGSQVVVISAFDVQQAYCRLSEQDDTVHFVYGDYTNKLIYYNTLSPADALGTPQQIASGVYTNYKPMANRGLVVFDNAGVDHAYVAWARASDSKLVGVEITAGTPGATVDISDVAVYLNPANMLSNQPVAAIAYDQVTGTIHAVWADNATHDMWRSERALGEAWTAAEEILDATDCEGISCNVIQYPSGGSKVLGLYYDVDVGVPSGGQMYYSEVLLAAGSSIYAKTGTVAAGTRATGEDVSEAVEAGALIAATLAAAGRLREISDTGAVIAGTRAGGTDVSEFVEAGSVRTGALASGDSDVAVPSKAGSLIAGTLALAADVFEAVETGAITAGTWVSAADVFEAVETGALSAGARAAGADVFTAAETGALVAGAGAAGADVYEAVETGKVVAGARASGADGAELSRAGALAAGTRAAGADTFEAVETGSLVASTRLRGSGQSGFISKLGALIAGALTGAADVFTASRTGALLTRAVASAADVFTASETGSLRAGTRLEGTSQKTFPVTYEKTGALAAGTLLRGVSMYESAIPVGHIEGNLSALVGVEGDSTVSALVEGATASTGVIE